QRRSDCLGPSSILYARLCWAEGLGGAAARYGRDRLEGSQRIGDAQLSAYRAQAVVCGPCVIIFRGNGDFHVETRLCSIMENPPTVDKEGYMAMPQGPGLGVTIRKDLIV